MISKNKTHNMRIVLSKVKRSSPTGKSIKIHFKEIHNKLTINVSKFEFESLRRGQTIRQLFKIGQVIRTGIISALMDIKMKSAFLMIQSMPTVRTLKDKRLEMSLV